MRKMGTSYLLNTTPLFAATDPVAVAVLLNELGAPPRLKVSFPSRASIFDSTRLNFYSTTRFKSLCDKLLDAYFRREPDERWVSSCILYYI